MEGSSVQDKKLLWKKLWSLQVPNKIKFFLWRCIWGFFRSKQNLYHRKILNSPSVKCAWLIMVQTVVPQVANQRYRRTNWQGKMILAQVVCEPPTLSARSLPIGRVDIMHE